MSRKMEKRGIIHKKFKKIKKTVEKYEKMRYNLK